jgi:hypothetical protein
MADSVGKGIALGERFKYDTTSGTKMLNDALQYKVASDRKKEADAVSSLDFKIDYKNLLPAYGKRIAEIATEPLNKYAQYKKEDPRTAMNRVQADFYEAQQKIGRLTRDNEAAKNYVSQKAGFAVNPDLVNALISTDSDFEAISKFNNGDFLNIGKDGEFAFRPIEVMNPSSAVKYDPQDYDTRFGGTKPIGIAGKTQIEQIEEVKPGAIARNAVALTTNPQFRDNVLLSRPDLIGLPEKEQYGAIYNEAFKISTQLARAPKSEWKIVDLPNPTGSGSGDKDKREKPVVVKNTKQTVLEGTGEIKEEKGLKTPVKKNVEGFIPISVSVAKTPAQTIPMDGRMIDATTNEYFKGEDLNQNVVFKPDFVYTESINKSGKYEKYVLGTATINKIDRKGVKTEKIITMKVPYDKVQSSIEGAYDLSDFDIQFNELQKTPFKKVGGSPTSTPVKQTKTVIAPNNSIGIKPEM